MPSAETKEPNARTVEPNQKIWSGSTLLRLAATLADPGTAFWELESHSVLPTRLQICCKSAPGAMLTRSDQNELQNATFHYALGQLVKFDF